MKHRKTIKTEIDMNQTQQHLNSFGQITKMDGLTQIRLELNEAGAIYIWNPMIDGYTRLSLENAVSLAEKLGKSRISYRKSRLMGNDEYILFIEPRSIWSTS
jgi:hypothetical protein